MKALKLPLLILTASTSIAFAENHMVLIGGGGEPERDYTIFDTGISTLGDNLKKSKWNYEVSFNGGHSKTEKILRDKFKSSIKPVTKFTEKSYLDLIADYKNRILSGNIKAGDQLMVVIDTHGAAKDNGNETHRISASGVASDLNNLEGSKTVSVDLLKELVELTNQRGIKLGIVDLSCHSGTTMALKKDAPNTCIISATGPVHYGFAGPSAFTDKFLLNLKSGTNLEEAFLQARIQSSDASYPMISTDTNTQIVNDVYAGITPYLYYYNEKTDKMTGYVQNTANSEMLCKRDNDFAQLLTKIDQLQSVVKSKKNGFNGDKLKSMLIDYKKLQDQILIASNKLGADKLKNVETFSPPPQMKSSDFKVQYTWKELLELDIDKRIEDYEKFKKFSQSANSKAENQIVIDFLKTVKEKKENIIKTYPDMNNFNKITKEMVSKMKDTRDMADKIAIQEKQFYEEMYRRNQNNDSNNPCRQMVF